MDAQFYKGRGNDALMTLTNNGAPVLPSTVTKVEFKYLGGAVNSVDNPDLFDFEATGIRIKFGASTLPIGTHQMRLIVFSLDHPEGIMWVDNLTVGVADG